jgi:hypothetical protein
VERLIALWQSEPARVVGAVAAVLAALVAFGVPITGDQSEKIVIAVGAVLFLLGSAEVTRSQVYSPETHNEDVATAYNEGHAEGRATAPFEVTFQNDGVPTR